LLVLPEPPIFLKAVDRPRIRILIVEIPDFVCDIQQRRPSRLPGPGNTKSKIWAPFEKRTETLIRR
jgi:hypothetical protein